MDDGINLLSNKRHRTVALLVTSLGGPGLLLLSRRATTLSPGATTGMLTLSSGVVDRGGLATVVMARGVGSTVTRNGHLVVVRRKGIVCSMSNRRGGGLGMSSLLTGFRRIDNKRFTGSHVVLDWSSTLWLYRLRGGLFVALGKGAVNSRRLVIFSSVVFDLSIVGLGVPICYVEWRGIMRWECWWGGQ